MAAKGGGKTDGVLSGGFTSFRWAQAPNVVKAATFFRAMLCTSAACAAMRCLSVRLFVCHVRIYSAKASDHILKRFFTAG